MIERSSSTTDKIASLLAGWVNTIMFISAELSDNALTSCSDVASELRNLVDLAQKVSASNLDIITCVEKYRKSAPAPELRYTWVQEPVKFEDALGRIIPVPSEYDLDVRRPISYKWASLTLDQTV
jgi:hypothetical protein